LPTPTTTGKRSGLRLTGCRPSYERLDDQGAAGIGYAATLGLRWLPIPQLELSGFAGARPPGGIATRTPVIKR